MYAALAAFCGAFSAVYLYFSHGVGSPFMTFLFVPPLLLGALPALLMDIHVKRTPTIAARRLWNSAVATLTTGFLLRAVVNISGRYTSYDTIYWVASGLLFLAAVACSFRLRTSR